MIRKKGRHYYRNRFCLFALKSYVGIRQTSTVGTATWSIFSFSCSSLHLVRMILVYLSILLCGEKYDQNENCANSFPTTLWDSVLIRSKSLKPLIKITPCCNLIYVLSLSFLFYPSSWRPIWDRASALKSRSLWVNAEGWGSKCKTREPDISSEIIVICGDKIRLNNSWLSYLWHYVVVRSKETNDMEQLRLLKEREYKAKSSVLLALLHVLIIYSPGHINVVRESSEIAYGKNI